MATKKKEEEKTCFVIMPFSDVEGYDKGHFTRVYKYLIKPACEVAGFKPIRADENSKADVIIVDILQKILECDMAICDMSSKNPNVFYELGFRHAFNKKTVLIKDIKTDLPFDTSSIRTITYNENLRIDEVKSSIQKIAEGLNETFTTNDDTGYSLLKLLSIKKPASISKEHELSEDSSIILDEIKSIKQQINQMNNTQISQIYQTITLSDNSIISPGDKIYLEDPESKQHNFFGIFLGASTAFFYIEKGDIGTIEINRNSPVAKSLTAIPF